MRKNLAVQFVANGMQRAGVTKDVSVTGLYIFADELPVPGERMVVDVMTKTGEVLRLHGRVAGRRASGDDSTNGQGFAFALEAYNEAYERMVLALSTPSDAFARPKRKSEPALVAVPARPAPEPPLVDARLVRILLVDPSERDDLALREAVSRIEIGSFQVEWVAGPQEALAALGQRRHDIAFVSWRVAPTGGLALIRRARAAGCEAPLVLLTNVHDRRLELEAVHEGAADVLDLAHLDSDTLEKTIRSTLERARLEAARHAAERELQDLYEKAPCGYQLLDEHGVILRINETALSWLGYEREELVGVRRFSDLLEPGSVPKYHEQVRWFLEPGRLRDLSLDLRRKDGTLLPVSASASLVNGAGPLRSRWTLLDMTERREREVTTRRVARAVETLQLGVVVTDLFGSILYANAALAAMVGRSAESLAGTDARLLVSDALRADAFRSRPGAPRWKADGLLISRDGSEHPVHVVSDVVQDELGAPIAIVTCCEERSGSEERRARRIRAAKESLVERLGAAESTLRELSEKLLDELVGDEE